MNGIKRLLSSMSKRTLVLTLTLVLSLATATGSTLAWLVDRTNPVKNTFTYGDVHIDLKESPSDVDDGDGNANTNTYKMLPGKVISKDPSVTVFQGTEDCYVYVQIDKSANFDSFMTFEVADGWLPLTGVANVYYREVNASYVDYYDVTYNVLKDNAVKVKDDVTTEMLRELDWYGEANYPTLTFTAYAVQRDVSIASINTPEAAWLTMQAETAEFTGAETPFTDDTALTTP